MEIYVVGAIVYLMVGALIAYAVRDEIEEGDPKGWTIASVVIGWPFLLVAAAVFFAM